MGIPKLLLVIFQRLPELVEREMPEGASVEIHEQVSEARPSTDDALVVCG